MNKLKVTQLVLIPFLVLGIAACAKRNKLTRKGKDAQAQAQTQDQTAKDKTRGEDGADYYAPNCVNPISMTPTQGEETTSLSEILNESNKGTYSLVQMEYFAETEGLETVSNPSAPSAREQIHTFGSEFKTPANLSSAVTDSEKARVVCHTTKAVEGQTSSIRGSIDLPNSFNAADGKGTVIRQDRVWAKNGRIEVVSTLYHGTVDIKHTLGEGKPEDMKVMIVKDTIGKIIIRLQFSRLDRKTGKKVNIAISGTYALTKADEKSETTEEKKEESKEETKGEVPAESSKEKTEKAS